jgi:hypothetical protein
MSTVLGEIEKRFRFSSAPIVLVVVLVLESLFRPARLKYLRFELWVVSAPQT